MMQLLAAAAARSIALLFSTVAQYELAPMNRARLGSWLLCATVCAFMAGPGRTAVGVAGAAADAEPQQGVPDGAAIRPEFAETLYKRLTPLQESDGCRLVRFDTQRFRIVIGLEPPAGGEVTFEIASAPDLRQVERRVGQWALAVPEDTERACSATVAAIQRVLQEVAAPQGGFSHQDGSGAAPSLLPSNHVILAVTFLLLLLGTGHLLYRELKTRRPPLAAVLLLALVWVAALALRLSLSPHAFMHEYYHIAETVPGYLSGEISGAYGKTGPALFRLMGALLRRPDDVGNHLPHHGDRVVAGDSGHRVARPRRDGELAAGAVRRRAAGGAAAAPALFRCRRSLRTGHHLRLLGVGALHALPAHAPARRRAGRRTGDVAGHAVAPGDAVLSRRAASRCVLLVEPRPLARPVAWPTLVALAVLGVLLVAASSSYGRRCRGTRAARRHCRPRQYLHSSSSCKRS